MPPKLNEYTPGVCNIGPTEISQRMGLGWSSGMATIILLVLFVFFDFAVGWRLLLVFPASLSASGFIQAYSHFCARFGVMGVFNFDQVVNKTTTIEQKEFIKQDRKKALQLIGYSVAIGIVVTVIAYFI